MIEVWFCDLAWSGAPLPTLTFAFASKVFFFIIIIRLKTSVDHNSKNTFVDSYLPFFFFFFFVYRYWLGDYLTWALINPTEILAGPLCGRIQPFAVVSWGGFSRPIYMEFITGIGNHKRAFNSTFFALYDFSKISKWYNSIASF